MPEGPSIRHTADMLREALLDQLITGFSSSLKKAAAQDWSSKFEDARVLGVRTHGKSLFIDISGGWTLYTHMLMWGSWHVYQQGQAWSKEARKARVVIETAEQVAVLFSAPVCELVLSADLDQHPTNQLGPDLLDEEFSDEERDEIRLRLADQGDTPLGVGIMNQEVMAGIGNILKSEILFACSLHPARSAASLSEHEVTELIETSLLLIRRSYELNGFDLAFLTPELRRATHRIGFVYGRSGQICLRCGNRIAMVRQGARERMTFYCPYCQPLDPASPPPPEERKSHPWDASVETPEQARAFVIEVGKCSLLSDGKAKLPALWDALVFQGSGDYPWGDQLIKLWQVRDALTKSYPNEICATSLRSKAMLFSRARLAEEYAANHKPIEQCSPLAHEVFSALEALQPISYFELRAHMKLTERKERSAFEKAFQELQSTFQIVRSPASEEYDLWMPLADLYPDLLA